MTTNLGYKPWLPTHQIFVNSPKIFITPWISNMDPRDATSASKKVTKVEMSAVFDVFAFCGKRTKADYKDWAQRLETLSWKSNYRHENFLLTFPGTWRFIMGLLEMTTQTVWFDSVEKEEQNKLFKKTVKLLNIIQDYYLKYYWFFLSWVNSLSSLVQRFIRKWDTTKTFSIVITVNIFWTSLLPIV